MFHSVRALLYSKGFSEKGHYCLFQFTSNIFKENNELFELIAKADMSRVSRQDIAYDCMDSNKEQAQDAINTAKELLELTKKILTK